MSANVDTGKCCREGNVYSLRNYSVDHNNIIKAYKYSHCIYDIKCHQSRHVVLAPIVPVGLQHSHQHVKESHGDNRKHDHVIISIKSKFSCNCAEENRDTYLNIEIPNEFEFNWLVNDKTFHRKDNDRIDKFHGAKDETSFSKKFKQGHERRQYYRLISEQRILLLYAVNSNRKKCNKKGSGVKEITVHNVGTDLCNRKPADYPKMLKEQWRIVLFFVPLQKSCQFCNRSNNKEHRQTDPIRHFHTVRKQKIWHIKNNRARKCKIYFIGTVYKFLSKKRSCKIYCAYNHNENRGNSEWNALLNILSDPCGKIKNYSQVYAALYQALHIIFPKVILEGSSQDQKIGQNR